ncbi:MAG: hypothetical protein OXF88_03180 [Rhodobacteraceae bacterium]|nr:hypothetical protein [Paracoccaceae bacterium]MCY4141972.1 hypothetical protein [Paracoccaceae bacterium]
MNQRPIEPIKEMSVTERNTHLWALLGGMGLYVEAIRPNGPKGEEQKDEIDCLIVSVAPPTVQLLVAETTTASSVGLPPEGAEIADEIGTASGFGNNVVNFPAVS